jgi:hypothetical protein
MNVTSVMIDLVTILNVRVIETPARKHVPEAFALHHAPKAQDTQEAPVREKRRKQHRRQHDEIDPCDRVLQPALETAERKKAGKKINS